jgi:hypothetical protein
VSVGGNLRVHFVNSELISELRVFLEIAKKNETRNEAILEFLILIKIPHSKAHYPHWKTSIF